MANKHLAEVAPIMPCCDVSKTLRVIADEIDAGQHGKVKTATLVVEADTIELFQLGTIGTDVSMKSSLWNLHNGIKWLDEFAESLKGQD